VNYQEKRNALFELAFALPHPYLEGGDGKRNPAYADALKDLTDAWNDFGDSDRGAILFEIEQQVIVFGDEDDTILLFALRSAEGRRHLAKHAIQFRQAIRPLDLEDGTVQDEMVAAGIARITRGGTFAINLGRGPAESLITFLRKRGHTGEATDLKATLPKKELPKSRSTSKEGSPKGQGERKPRQSRKQETLQEKFDRLSAVKDIQKVSPEDVRDGKVTGLSIMNLPGYGKVVVTSKVTDDEPLFVRFQGSDTEESNKLFGERDGYLRLKEALGVEDSAPEASADTSETPEVEVEITPAARKLAEENGIDISTIEGTGASGIVIGDVKTAIAAQADADAAEEQEAAASTEPVEAVETKTGEDAGADAPSSGFVADAKLEAALAQLQERGMGKG